MDEKQLTAFVADLKTVLNITWYAMEDDARLAEIVRGGEAYLNEKYGAAADYTVPGLPRTLLFEYSRYARDNALDVFENNYQSLILTMQNQRMVALFAQQQEEGAPA